MPWLMHKTEIRRSVALARTGHRRHGSPSMASAGDVPTDGWVAKRFVRRYRAAPADAGVAGTALARMGITPDYALTRERRRPLRLTLATNVPEKGPHCRDGFGKRIRLVAAPPAAHIACTASTPSRRRTPIPMQEATNAVGLPRADHPGRPLRRTVNSAERPRSRHCDIDARDSHRRDHHRTAVPPKPSEPAGAGAAQPPSAALCEQSSVSSASKGSSPDCPG